MRGVGWGVEGRVNVLQLSLQQTGTGKVSAELSIALTFAWGRLAGGGWGTGGGSEAGRGKGGWAWGRGTVAGDGGQSRWIQQTQTCAYPQGAACAAYTQYTGPPPHPNQPSPTEHAQSMLSASAHPQVHAQLLMTALLMLYP